MLFLWIWDTYDDTEWTKTVYSNTLTDKNDKTETITVYSDEKTVG